MQKNIYTFQTIVTLQQLNYLSLMKIIFYFKRVYIFIVKCFVQPEFFSIFTFFSQGGQTANIAESFCEKIPAILAHSAILGTPFVLRAYIAGSFLPNCIGFLPKNFGKFGDIGPPVIFTVQPPRKKRQFNKTLAVLFLRPNYINFVEI